VYKIDSAIKPELYFLRDLMKENIDGSFYKEQLTLTSKPDYKNNFFEVEKVLHVKKFKGEKYFFCEISILQFKIQPIHSRKKHEIF